MCTLPLTPPLLVPAPQPGPCIRSLIHASLSAPPSPHVHRSQASIRITSTFPRRPFSSCPGPKRNVSCCASAFSMVCDRNSTCGFTDLSAIPLLELKLHEAGSRCGVHCHGPPDSRHRQAFSSREGLFLHSSVCSLDHSHMTVCQVFCRKVCLARQVSEIPPVSTAAES